MMTFVLQNGWSPLHCASFNGNLDIVRALIEAGANISHAHKDGKTAMNIAVVKGHKDIIQVLETDQSKIFNIMAQQLCGVRQQLHDMKKESEQQLHDLKKQTEQQLYDMRQQKELQLRDMNKQTEQQLFDMRQQKEQKKQQLHDTRQQKEQTEQQLRDMKKQTEQQLHDMRQWMEQKEQKLKEQIDASEKRLRTTEVKCIQMQLKYKSLKRELHEMVQKADASQITQTTNFMDYNPMNSSISRNSSDDEEEHL
ncbi:hypothetical protein EMCRGX_G004102 [Ephydatia muelleri]